MKLSKENYMTCEMLVEVMSKDDHKIDPIQMVFFREVDKIDCRYIIFKSGYGAS